jgi:hypothetical protein
LGQHILSSGHGPLPITSQQDHTENLVLLKEEDSAVLLKSECDLSEVDSLSVDTVSELCRSQVNFVVKAEASEDVDTDLKTVVSEGIMDSKGDENLGQICNVCLAITLDPENHSR